MCIPSIVGVEGKGTGHWQGELEGISIWFNLSFAYLNLVAFRKPEHSHISSCTEVFCYSRARIVVVQQTRTPLTRLLTSFRASVCSYLQAI